MTEDSPQNRAPLPSKRPAHLPESQKSARITAAHVPQLRLAPASERSHALRRPCAPPHLCLPFSSACRFFGQASADKPWLPLGKASGPTPGNVAVTYDSAGLAAGVYTGTVTFSSPDVPQTVPVQVVLTLAEGGPGEDHSLYLPAVLRE